jgi:hypothetical protein
MHSGVAAMLTLQADISKVLQPEADAFMANDRRFNKENFEAITNSLDRVFNILCDQGFIKEYEPIFRNGELLLERKL